MKLKNFLAKELNEGISSVLYHKTNLSTAYDILKSNKFTLSLSSMANKLNHDKKESYFLSTARNMRGSYYGDACFELDGTKLSNNYKGQAIDYWGDKNSKFPSGRSKNRGVEAEDRIFSNKSSINNASKYIKTIYVLIKGDDFSKYYGKIERIKNAAAQKNIPAFFFTDKKDYLNKNKSKAMEISDPMYKQELSLLLSFMNKTITKKQVEDLNHALRYSDRIRNIEYELSNSVKGSSGTRPEAVQVIKELKKAGYSSLEKYVEEKVMPSIGTAEGQKNIDKGMKKKNDSSEKKRIDKILKKRKERISRKRT